MSSRGRQEHGGIERHAAGSLQGTVPATSDRHIRQILHGVLPRLLEPLDPLLAGTPEAAHLPEWITRRPVDHTTRRFVAASRGVPLALDLAPAPAG
jgi:hypothetical protein